MLSGIEHSAKLLNGTHVSAYNVANTIFFRWLESCAIAYPHARQQPVALQHKEHDQAAAKPGRILLEQHERRGDHVLGKHLAEVRAQLLHTEGRLVGNEVGHQHLARLGLRGWQAVEREQRQA